MTADELDIEALTVLDSMHQHIALLDPAGTVIAVNRAWTEFGDRNHGTGGDSTLLGQNYLDVCGASGAQPQEPTAQQARDGIRAVLAGTQTRFEMEYPCHGPAQQRWFLLRATPLVGNRRGAVVSHEDITARWLLEQQRAGLIAELQTANHELNEFAYVVSHDLKAPLRGISTLSSWLLEDCAEKLGPEGREQLGLIHSRVKRLSGLIDAILSYSRAGRSQVIRSLVDLHVLVRNTIDLLAPPPHVRVQIIDPLPLLSLHAVQAQQVFQNLLSNAIDFMDKAQGQVRLRCRLDGPFWHFEVADNGPGIEERHFERIFQLFQTLNARDAMERTGVGLALVKKIIELEGGALWVTSTVGQGTTFHFTLPAVPPSATFDPDPDALFGPGAVLAPAAAA